MGTTPLKLISDKSLNLTFKVTYVTPCIFSTSELNKQQSSALDGGVVVAIGCRDWGCCAVDSVQLLLLVVVVVCGGGGGGGQLLLL